MPSSSDRTTTGPVLGGAEPVLYVTDFAASLAFFTQSLGFAVDFTYGEPPFYGVVQRDGARLCLRLVREPVFVGDVRARAELLSAAIPLASAAAIKTIANAIDRRGSLETIPSRPASINRPSATDSTRPTATPTTVRRAAWPTVKRSTSRRLAPSAIRTPISWVR